MNEELVGYLLNGLEPDELRAVERQLEANPELRQELSALRQAIEPLEADGEPPAPPADLVVNTLKRITQQRCQPPAMRIPATIPFPRSEPAIRGRWRRADVFVAASISFFTLLLIPPGMLKVQYHQRVTACADNLRAFHNALVCYEADNGALPRPEPSGRFAVAGIYAPAIRQAGYWSDKLRVNCPASERPRTPQIPTFEDLKTADQDAYDDWTATMGGSYGFHLGYVDDRTGELKAVNRKQLGGDVPIMSDRPPRVWEPFDNSPNHHGFGQNVLFLNGQVRFLRTHEVGGDDIFRNQNNKVAAGYGPRDAVLAPSEARPFPADD